MANSLLACEDQTKVQRKFVSMRGYCEERSMRAWNGIRGLFAQSQDCRVELGSEVCARKSEDGANPHFPHNITQSGPTPSSSEVSMRSWSFIERRSLSLIPDGASANSIRWVWSASTRWAGLDSSSPCEKRGYSEPFYI